MNIRTFVVKSATWFSENSSVLVGPVVPKFGLHWNFLEFVCYTKVCKSQKSKSFASLPNFRDLYTFSKHKTFRLRALYKTQYSVFCWSRICIKYFTLLEKIFGLGVIEAAIVVHCHFLELYMTSLPAALHGSKDSYAEEVIIGKVLPFSRYL